MWESSAVPELFASDRTVRKRPANRRLCHDAPDGSELKGRLWEIIGAEVLPRLFQANGARTAAETGANPAPAEPAKLARMLIAGRNDAFRREIVERLASGLPPLVVMTEVLAPIARVLGRLWDNDDADLIDMQRACGALKRWIGEIAPEAGVQIPAKSPSILLQVAPGERHTLGVDIAEAVFRGAGWRVARGEARGFHADLAQEWRDVLGFSLSCERHIEALAKAIPEARMASRNPRLLVVVGGPIFAERPNIVENIGADFCACAAEMPVHLSDALINGTPMPPL
jgi:methanogenic corrinoid protein MtbC1